MSSCQRFLKQVAPSNTYYAVSAVVKANPESYLYDFAADSANVVGNYPPGVMTPVNSNFITNAAGVLSDAAPLVLRDMGKTIKAPLTTALGAVGFYRQVQLLVPGAVNNVGGSSGTSSGVLGGPTSPSSLTPYATCYIPVVVLGQLSAPLPVGGFPAVAGGQM
jgi:hypothetical protein